MLHQTSSPRPAPAQPTRSGAGNRIAPIVPQTMDEVRDYAKLAVGSGIFKSEGGNAEAQATMIIFKALDMGLPITLALQSMAIKDNNVIVKAEAMRAMIWGAGFKIEETVTGEGDKRTATCLITRPDGTRGGRMFSVSDAKKALVYQTDPLSYWQRYEDRLLAARALGFCGRDVASDVVAGLYVREELDGVTPSTVRAGPAGPVDEVPHTKPRAAVVTDFDIPVDDDTAAAPAGAATAEHDTSPEALLRTIQRDLESGIDARAVEASYIAAINALDETNREQAFAMLYPDK